MMILFIKKTIQVLYTGIEVLR